MPIASDLTSIHNRSNGYWEFLLSNLSPLGLIGKSNQHYFKMEHWFNGLSRFPLVNRCNSSIGGLQLDQRTSVFHKTLSPDA